MKHEDCDHKWNWDKETRFCLSCRQVRTFPQGEESGRVLWLGLDDKRDPLELPPKDKSAIAHLAQELGVKKASDCIKIDWVLLRAWVGNYCGDRRHPHKPRLDKSIKLSKEDKSPDPVKLSSQPEAQPEAQSASHDTHQSPKSLLSTPVSKSDHKVDLPPFPPFSNDWLPEVQMEWLEVFSGLIKGSN